MTQNSEVARRRVVIRNFLGLHMRAADRFVKVASLYQSEVQVLCKGATANGKSILSLLSLAAECGTVLDIEASGQDAEDTIVALAALVADRFDETDSEGGEVA